MYPLDASYRSFASLRMTEIASLVILSAAKDLCVALPFGIEGDVLPYASMHPSSVR